MKGKAAMRRLMCFSGSHSKRMKSTIAFITKRLPAGMSAEHLVLTLVILLAGYVLCGWPEGSPETGGSRRSPHAWSGATPDKSARVVRLEGDIEHPGIYVLAPGKALDEVLREAGVRGEVPDSLPGRFDLGTILVLRSLNGSAQVAGLRDMPNLERLILGLPLDVNTIKAETLSHIPGIGHFRAEKIVAERIRRGGFQSMAEIESVPGIGSKIRKKIEQYLEVFHPSFTNLVQ